MESCLSSSCGTDSRAEVFRLILALLLDGGVDLRLSGPIEASPARHLVEIDDVLSQRGFYHFLVV